MRNMYTITSDGVEKLQAELGRHLPPGRLAEDHAVLREASVFHSAACQGEGHSEAEHQVAGPARRPGHHPDRPSRRSPERELDGDGGQGCQQCARPRAGKYDVRFAITTSTTSRHFQRTKYFSNLRLKMFQT